MSDVAGMVEAGCDVKRQAADDMGFVLFDFWRLPTDQPVYAASAAYGGEHAWEQAQPM